MPQLLTQKEYARKIGKSPQYVNKLVRQGKIPTVGTKISPRLADAAIKAWSRPGRVVGKKTPAKAAKRATGTPRRESETAKLTKYRALREKAGAERAELELKALTKQLLPAAEVLEAERRKNANVRASFRRLARSLAPLLHRATSPAEVEQLLLGEIDLVLSELARDPLGVSEVLAAAAPVEQELQPPPVPASPPTEVHA